jgi:hypothetical protein
MEKIYKLILPLLCLIGFWACDEDKDGGFFYKDPTTFVLNTPSYVSGIYDLKNTESVQLTCSQPDYGFTAVTVYHVQIAIQSDFSEFATLTTPYYTAKMEVDASEIAVALVNLLGIENPEDYPVEPMPVYVRLTASLMDDQSTVLDLGYIESNIITLPKVKGYFALPSMELPKDMYIIGNVAGNWNWGDATKMVPVHSAPGKFWAVQYLGKADDGSNAAIKFNQAKAWDDTAFGIQQADIDNASKSLAGISGEDNIEIGNPGWYIVVVTTEIAGRDYIYRVQFLEPKVYLSGDAAGGVWGAGDNNLFTVPNISLGADADFVSPTFVGATGDGGVRACVVLSGQEWWHTEFMVFSGKLEYRGTEGDQERVAGSVGQKLYINFTKGTGKIE